MKSRYVKILVVVGICLLALVAVQIRWMMDAWTLKNREFDKSVATALTNVSTDFEDYLFCNEVFANIEINAGQGINLSKKAWVRNEDGTKLWQDTAQNEPVTFYYQGDNDTLMAFDGLKLNYPATIQLVAKITTGYDSAAVFKAKESANAVTSKNFKENVVDIVNPMAFMGNGFLDSVMRHNLGKEQLDLDFTYQISDSKDEKIYQTEDWAKTHAKTAYQSEILEENYFFQPYQLAVHFPEKQSFLLKGNILILSVSIIIIFALIISFFVFVKFLFRQVHLNKMKTNFVNNMTHEFKTPTANISLAIENMVGLNGEVPSRVKKYIKIINEENRRMITNVEKILEVARYSEDNEMKLVTTEVDLNEILYEVSRNFGYRMKKANGIFKKRLHAEHHFIKCDRHHVKNVISNILDNALKYCDKEIPEVVLDTYSKGDEVFIAINDNGPGIDSMDMKRIFDPFFRKDTGNLHNVKGFGLGLSYVKRAVEMHGGRVEVESKNGRGATFTVVLPVLVKKEAYV